MAPAGFSSATLHRLHPSAALRMSSSSSFASPASNSAQCSHAIGCCRKFEARLVWGLGFRAYRGIGASEPQTGWGLGFTVQNGVIRACLGRTEQELGIVAPAREENYNDAVRALANGHVVAVPTDTLYGLACDASSAEAIRRVYEIKERQLSSPLAVCVADVDAVASYGETAHLPPGLLSSLLPGAVTLLLPRRESDRLSPSLNSGVASIGIRIPESSFVRGLSRSFGGALALTSANTSSHASTVRISEFQHLWPQCAFVFDAGTLPGGRAGSTIVDLTNPGVFLVVRPGSVLQKTRETLAHFGLQDASTSS